MSNASYSINLNRDTFDLLHKVQQDLVKQLGFEPTLGQVVRHLIAVYNKE